MRTRSEILTDLVHLNGNVDELKSEIEMFGWDSDGDLYVLDKEDIINALTLFSNGNISARVLEDWANAIECREDVGFESTSIQEAINELANPILYGELSNERVANIKRSI